MDSIESFKSWFIEREEYLKKNETKIKTEIKEDNPFENALTDLNDLEMMFGLFDVFLEYFENFEWLIPTIEDEHRNELSLQTTKKEKVKYWKKKLKKSYKELSESRFYYGTYLDEFLNEYGNYDFTTRLAGKFRRIHGGKLQAWYEKKFYKRTTKELEALRDAIVPGRSVEYFASQLTPIENEIYLPDEEKFSFDHYFKWELEELWLFIAEIIKIFYIQVQLGSDLKLSAVGSKRQFDRHQVILLMDRLKMIQHIENKPTTMQAKIISEITGFSYDNIRKSLNTLNSSPKDLTSKQNTDIEKIDDYIKKLG